MKTFLTRHAWPLAWTATLLLLAATFALEPSSLFNLADPATLLVLANAPAALELKSIVESIQRGFEQFKQTNDERLTAIEKSRSDSDFQAKLAKIQDDLAKLMDLKKDIEHLEAKANRAGLAGGNVDPEKAEYKSAFMKWARKGDESSLRAKAWSVGTAADGGYTVPEELDREIEKLARDFSAMRQCCRVVQVGTSDYKKLVNLNGIASGWVGETAARPATNTSQYAELTPFMGEIYANPQITQQMLDDSFLDVEAEIRDQLIEEFSVAEGAAFLTGDGTNKPKGILAYTTAAQADAARSFGVLEHIPTGVSADFAASNKADVFLVALASLKKAYREGSNWMMNKAVMFEVMRIKDSTGQYLWQPSMQAGVPVNIFGYPVMEAEDMPAKAANSLSIAYGNFRRGYTIVDRIGTRMLRDPYTNKPYVGFYTTKRVGGFLVNSQAIKVIKFSAS